MFPSQRGTGCQTRNASPDQPPRARSRGDRWADKQNAKLQQKFQADLTDWQRTDQDLERLQMYAAGYAGADAAAVGSSVLLKRGETAFYFLPQASLVEVRRAPGHYTGGYSGFSFRISRRIRYNVGGSRGTFVQGEEAQKIVDVGAVTVTSQRVVFQGTKNTREWAYSKLIGVEEDPARPLTMIHVSNRQKVSGLLYPAGATEDFRFFLALATAQFVGDGAKVAAGLAAERAEHTRAQPTQPILVAADQAPAGLRRAFGLLGLIYFGRPGVRPQWRIAQSVLACLLTLAVIGGITGPKTAPSAHSLGEASGASTSRATSVVASPSARTTTPARATTPSAVPATHRPAPSTTVTPRVTATKATVVAKATPAKPKPKPVALCGAPANPFRYTFCGGSLIYSPAADTCAYFNCIANWDNGTGYMVECQDGTFSMSGGRSGACSHHSGESRPVYHA